MINNLSVTAVIPVRGGSRRVPNKNIRKFGDSSLLVNKIRQLKQVELIDKIVVSSDSDAMLQIAADENVEIQKRPLEYCDEMTRTFNEVVEYVASHTDGDVMMWTPCTCPLVEPDNYEDAIKLFEKSVLISQEYDSVVSAKILKEYVFDENGPVNFNPVKHVPSQDLPNWMIIINGFLMAMRKDMIFWKYFYGKKPLLVTVDKISAFDIDDMDDFVMAELIYNKRHSIDG
jgi:N-acylneuraminate cytidylyltransferase